MQKFFINLILKINKKYFFKKSHPFNIEKDGTLNLNYSDFEYNHTDELLIMYEKINPLAPLLGGIKRLLENKKVLDIGCGGGGKSVYLAEKYESKVTGIDISDNFLNQANNFAKEKGISNSVVFYNKSAIDTGFRSEEFDVIIMSDVIEHIPETEKLFKEVFRILKKGGIILFDFAPYCHYFGHHLWDTIQIPWIHLFFTDKFLIRLYKTSVKDLVDGDNRINLRVGKDSKNMEVFDYLNKITRKKFEKIISDFIKKNNINDYKINYFILKNINIISKIPFLREVFIRHIVGFIKK